MHQLFGEKFIDKNTGKVLVCMGRIPETTKAVFVSNENDIEVRITADIFSEWLENCPPPVYVLTTSGGNPQRSTPSRTSRRLANDA